MPYDTNPNLPKVRQRAVNLVYQGWSTRKVARHLGVGTGTVSKWLKRDPWRGLRPLPTLSSRPRSHPRALSDELVNAVVAKRRQRNRCAEVIHAELVKEGWTVSLSSVKRILKRHGMIRRRSPWKRWHFEQPRPEALQSGDLVQVDTVHFLFPGKKERFYVYTLLDVFSRWAWAKVSLRVNTYQSLFFVREAERRAPFSFLHLQSDHGSEFSTWFTENVKIAHRHSRVRKPNDNGHLERFNRTLQEECLSGIPCSPERYQRAIARYLPYYNSQRTHIGINYRTPLECVQGID